MPPTSISGFMPNVTMESRHTLSVNLSSTLWIGSTEGAPAPTKEIVEMTWDDATWILTSSFIIFTMQSGFGLLEAGSVSSKNEVNIMVKNAVDVIFGGLTYWAFGYGLALGEDEGSTPFYGVGQFAVDSTPATMGVIHATFIFQLSFATTATTIVSGAMAERTKLSAYILFSLLNTVVYCLPAHWLWAKNGFLYTLGVIDIAGSGGVHLVGGTSGLIATLLLRPRLGKYQKEQDSEASTFEPGNPTNCLVGMFMLWWGWLGFNCGSTFGISGGKWKMAAKSAVTTILSSMGGGIVGLSYSYILRGRIFVIADLVNSILGALVSVTAVCALIHPWEAIFVGAIGAFVVVLFSDIFEKLHIDDPVGALSVHGIGGIWGMLVVGFLVENDPVENYDRGNYGLFKGGGGYLLGVQILACICVIVWSGSITFLLLMVIKKTVGLRMTEYEEIMGADYVEHRVTTQILGSELQEKVAKARLALPTNQTTSFSGLENGGFNLQHETPFVSAYGTYRSRQNSEPEVFPNTSTAQTTHKQQSFGFKTKSTNNKNTRAHLITDQPVLRNRPSTTISTISETEKS